MSSGEMGAFLRRRQQLKEEEPVTSSKNEAATVKPEASKKKRGRPSGGRSSNPDYTQITVYIPEELKYDIEDLLVKLRRSAEKKSDVNLSQLVEDLLTEWRDKQAD